MKIKPFAAQEGWMSNPPGFTLTDDGRDIFAVFLSPDRLIFASPDQSFAITKALIVDVFVYRREIVLQTEMCDYHVFVPSSQLSLAYRLINEWRT